jgi:D-alanyl-D-alanine carboxypeptidase/D-alanyl-D-alanine-endopeptidase (penicillin-binding protein 4)
MKSLFCKITAVLILVTAGVIACQSSEKLTTSQTTELPGPSRLLSTMLDTSEVFSSHLTGFALYDPAADSMIYARNGSRYFTPASNMKLFTFYAGLKLLPDSVKGLEYVVNGDSLIFWGTGDPSFLHPDFGNDKVYTFLKDRKEKLYFSDINFDDEPLGSGWSWSDYRHHYQVEKSSLPVFGNVARFTVHDISIRKIASSDSGLAVSPQYFQSFVREKNGREDAFLRRGIADNDFAYEPVVDTTTYTVDKPFHYSPELITGMLADTLEKRVEYIEVQKPDSVNEIYSIPTDTVYKRMLQSSDNFIAEQLLLVMASELKMPLNSQSVIDKVESEFLEMLPQEPQWVDGSGLSRYNMVTPISMIYLLQAIDSEFTGDDKLFEFFPAGGSRGTIEDWYGSRDDGPPYVFAKTGTLSNNHSLSGYLITQSGKKLLFSFMNNHYVTSSSVVKEEMEKILWFIHTNVR